MKKYVIIILGCIFGVLSFVGCSREKASTESIPKTEESTQDNNESNTKTTAIPPIYDFPTITIPDFPGKGLINTGVHPIISHEPAYTEGVILRSTYLYPVPNEGLYEMGVIPAGRKVTILCTVDYHANDPLTGKEREFDSEKYYDYWSLVSYGKDDLKYIGYVVSSDIAPEEEASVEEEGPYKVKKGGTYYLSPECIEPISDDYPVAMIIKGFLEDFDCWKLEGEAGWQCYVKSLDELEPSYTLIGDRIRFGN